MSAHHITRNISLKAYNTFAIEAKSAEFCTVAQPEALQALLLNPSRPIEQTMILGGGSNVLLTQDYPGLIIKNEISGIEVVKENDHHLWLRIGAGENWHQFVEYCLAHNYAGVENLSLIPGTVGAAPMQNIGAYGVELETVFDRLEAIRIRDAKPQIFTHDECEFAYRNSIFKSSLKNQYVITHVQLRLNKQPNIHADYRPLANYLEHNAIKQPSIHDISSAVMAIRKSKLPDPNILGNAGSFFKNPIVDKEQFSALQTRFSKMPAFSVDADRVKIPAAWLIEHCGWKGKRFGDAAVHHQQALVLVNHGQASGHEILQLAQNIQTSVNDKFGIELQPEVNIIQ